MNLSFFVLLITLKFIICDDLGTCSTGEKILSRGVSPAEAQEIVDFHNKYRDMIRKGQVEGQPAGKDLGNFKWDATLAESSTAVSDSCIFAHNCEPYVGQNVYQITTLFNTCNNNFSWSNAINLWFLEYKHYLYPKGSIDGEEVGHYTQIVSNRTQSFGCSRSCFPSNYNGYNTYTTIATCNYAPGGNIEGVPPYTAV